MRFSEIMQIPFMCSLFLLCGCSAGDGGETAAVTLHLCRKRKKQRIFSLTWKDSKL